MSFSNCGEAWQKKKEGFALSVFYSHSQIRIFIDQKILFISNLSSILQINVMNLANIALKSNKWLKNL